MHTDLIAYLAFLITFQLFLLGVFLVTHRKGNRRNNRLLGLVFLLIAWNLADITLKMNHVILEWKILQSLDDGFFLIYGPLIYLYVNGVIYKDFKLNTQHLIHLVPYVLFCALLFIFTDHMPATPEDMVEQHLPWQFYIGSALIYIHFFTYLFLAIRALQAYRQVIKIKFSEIELINLNWLSVMLSTFTVLAGISLIHNLIPLAADKNIFMITLVLLLLFVFYFVIKVIFKALRQPEIFAGILQGDTIKYKGSNLAQDQITSYKDRLEQLMRDEKPYLNAKVSLADLSEKLAVSPKHLSQVINQSFNKSFFDYVNSYRVKEAQTILIENDDPKMTVLEVMFEVGFNSKSSFNTAFKKETGLTPTQFKKSS